MSRAWWKQMWEAFAHHQTKAYLAAIAMTAASAVVEDAGGPSSAWFNWAVTGFFFLALGAGRKHDRMLCMRCAESFPVDAGAAAERRKWMMRSYHWCGDHPLRFGTLWVGPPMLAVAVSEISGHDLVVLATGVYLWLLSGGAAFAVVAARHNRFQPWCPWCDHGDGGWDESEEPEPGGPTHGRGLPRPVAAAR